MLVYILSPGRSGEKTLASACGFMSNYTFGQDRPHKDNYIAFDRHLAWSLNQLNDSAMFVHLEADRSHTASAYHRFGFDEATVAHWTPLVKGRLSVQPGESDAAACLEYVDCVAAGIRSAIATRKHHLAIRSTTRAADFTTLWERIGAEGNLKGALELFRLNEDLAAYLPLLSEPEDHDDVAQENPA